MGIFDYWKKERAKPDFSNVQSGGSSTAPAPVPRADGDSSPAGSLDTRHVRRGQGRQPVQDRRAASMATLSSGAGSSRRTAISSRTPT